MSRVMHSGRYWLSRPPRAAPGARRWPRRHGVGSHAVEIAARSFRDVCPSTPAISTRTYRLI